MKYQPHDYQQYATDFILSHPVAAILLQMGLGKSVITLTAMKELFDRGEISRALVVAPLRVARDTWPEEIRKWDHLQDLTFSVAVGTAEARRAALRREVQIHIINRENLAWMAESGLALQYDMIVADELSSFKNCQSKRFRALLRLRPSVQRIVGLTGTPTGNGLMDLFGEYRVLDLGERLGRFISSYRKAYFLPDKMNAYQIFSWKPRPGAEEAIYRKISDITVSMKSADFLKMPECVMNEVKVFMEENERRLYDEMKEELFLRMSALSGPEGTVVIDAKNAAALCGKLSQMANGACYTEDGSVALIHDRKLDALEDLIEAANGHPVLIAYWYQHDLQRIRARFPETKALRSTADIADWNAGRIPVAAIHPASAGHGLNLQRGGNILIWYGLTWSLELYQQTNARLWRQGQQAETVTIHHIVTEGTIDEEILGALGCKDKTQESLIAAVKAQIPTKLKRRAG
ncbi:MAG: DEAD/DEAH box helicase [Clostridia bacterium]|nr:DEAD/DEAH box helicase [Clostridia bacterium]